MVDIFYTFPVPTIWYMWLATTVLDITALGQSIPKKEIHICNISHSQFYSYG